MITIGIQGGKGSFNEEATNHYCKVHGIKEYELKYLYTTEQVLRAIHMGNVDYGNFAISNPTGGIVEESITALSKYNIIIIEMYPYRIRHFLMVRDDLKDSKFSKIMTHPQVYRQCYKTLKKKYPDVIVKHGEGELIDQAKVAEQLSQGKLDKTIAVMGSKVIADVYPNLKIIDEDLQDNDDNQTTFIFCKRRYII